MLDIEEIFENEKIIKVLLFMKEEKQNEDE
jgi:hypothetical protein